MAAQDAAPSPSGPARSPVSVVWLDDRTESRVHGVPWVEPPGVGAGGAPPQQQRRRVAPPTAATADDDAKQEDPSQEQQQEQQQEQ